ncbi:hypothetical protein DPMN_041450 [Dreissena polymorpha]|uniref:Uncharacterized protein n=1 Tax=Dreissena polymorpha TaxID=45954 RepID=A0A9D4CZ30_DREPO|nr:hypothetical protein DPMN_041450 [Dreissena polymorpha]
MEWTDFNVPSIVWMAQGGGRLGILHRMEYRLWKLGEPTHKKMNRLQRVQYSLDDARWSQTRIMCPV